MTCQRCGNTSLPVYLVPHKEKDGLVGLLLCGSCLRLRQATAREGLKSYGERVAAILQAAQEEE